MRFGNRDKNPQSIPAVERQDSADKNASGNPEPVNLQKWTPYLMTLGLAVITLGLFWKATSFEFINYDDPNYVTDNYYVRQGVTAESVKWAFSHVHASNWHPLTWISHMIDVDLFGVNPNGHHAINIVLHTFSTLLLFRLLIELTGARWRSLIVAALFAWHPLHIQSVAWVAERKDILSAFFAFWTILFYGRYARDNQKESSSQAGRRNLLLSIISFACGLLCKPMLVTMPVWLLLLDFWPLNRVDFGSRNRAGAEDGFSKSITHLLLEKAPFIFLSAGSVLITLIAQKGAIENSIPFALRASNACVSVCSYIGKMFWPMNLAVHYPYPDSIPIWKTAAAATVIVAITSLTIIFRRRWSFAIVGWLWFLVGLLPVIGLVQVGNQSMADRYTYLPMIGLFVATVWGIGALLPSFLSKILAAIVLVSCLCLTSFQLEFWRSDLSLFDRAAEVTEANVPAYSHVADDFISNGQPDAAIATYESALKRYPGNLTLLNNFGRILAQFKKFDAAIEQFQKVLAIEKNHARAHSNLGAVLATVGKSDEGKRHLVEALRLDPTDAEVHINLGGILASESKTDEALTHYLDAIRLAPDNSTAHLRAARILVQKDPKKAVEHFEATIELLPNRTEPLTELSWLLATNPRPDVRNGSSAVKWAERACKLTGFEDFKALGVLDAAYAENGQFDAAILTADATRAAALKAGRSDYVKAAEYRRSLYMSGRAFHQE